MKSPLNFVPKIPFLFAIKTRLGADCGSDHELLIAKFKIAGRNINNLRYADDTTLMAESEEELKILLMTVKAGVKKLA